MRITLPEVTRIVDHWKPKLGLEKWTIRLLLVGGGTLEGAYGDCSADGDSRTALIRINEEQESRIDLHDTVIHELFHVLFWWAEHEGIAESLEEQTFRDFTPYLAQISLEKMEHTIFESSMY